MSISTAYFTMFTLGTFYYLVHNLYTFQPCNNIYFVYLSLGGWALIEAWNHIYTINVNPCYAYLVTCVFPQSFYVHKPMIRCHTYVLQAYTYWLLSVIQLPTTAYYTDMYTIPSLQTKPHFNSHLHTPKLQSKPSSITCLKCPCIDSFKDLCS